MIAEQEQKARRIVVQSALARQCRARAGMKYAEGRWGSYPCA